MPRDEQINRLRITNVGYLNSVPYQAFSQLEGVEYDEAEPAECARKLHEEETDLALIPLAEYFMHGGYHAFPFGIVAAGPVESVFVFSASPLSELKTVLLDHSSLTSVTLFRIALASLFPERVPHVRLARVGREEALSQIGGTVGALVIGDRAFLARNQYPFQYDLAQLWVEATELPFVFAIWAGRESSLLRRQQATLEKCFEAGIKNREIYARDWAERHGYDRAAAVRYVTGNIEHRIGEIALCGIEEYLKRGQKIGILPKGQVRFIDSNSGVNGSGRNRPSVKRNAVSVFDLDLQLERASSGERLSTSDVVQLAQEASLADLSLASDLVRRRLHPKGGVSYIVDRNINYTNVCNVYCRFCAFYRAPGKSDGYVLSREEIGSKIEEMLAAGGKQVLLQGGLNPELGISYYEDLFRWIKERYSINLHALSSDEIWHIARVSHLSLEQVLTRLIAAGMGSLPGGGAEILVDRVRRRIARLKTTSDEWLEVHRVAHRLGLHSTCTMMFGVQENWWDRALHLQKLRQLQDESNGFTAFIAWPFQDENTKLKRSDTSPLEYLRVQAIARLFLDNIPNIQSSWVTQGPSVGSIALSFGANDFGSVMFEENVVSAAGTTFCMDSKTIERHIVESGFSPWRRDVHYQPV